MSSDGKRLICDRTKAFAVRIIRLHAALPRTGAGRVMANQVLRSGTSIGAHCREAYRSRSTAEAISKLEVALQEADETSYWMELLVETKIMSAKRLEKLLKECDELIRMLVAAVRTMKRRRE